MSGKFRNWLCSFVVVYLPVANAPVYAESNSRTPANGPTPTRTTQKQERRSDPMCGPRSLWVAAGRLGISLDLKELAETCNMTKAGTTMLDLKKGAIASGLQAEGVRLIWDDLVKLNAPAILFVSDDHFCCVDPREKFQGNTGGRLRVYDLPGATLWMARGELESIWRGEALVVRSDSFRASTDGPAAQFEATFVDFGMAKEGTLVTNEFILKNVGSATLRILAVRGSCGCAGLDPTRTEIPPGETGKIIMKLDLHGRQGPQLIQGFVKTDDPDKSLISLTYRGMVERPVLVRPYLFDFGQLIPGQERKREVIVTDRGDQTLQLTGGSDVILDTFVGNGSLDKSVPEEGRPSFQVHYVPHGVSIGQTYTTAQSSSLLPAKLKVEGYPLRYNVTVTCSVRQSTPYGKYFGTLQLRGERQNGETSEVLVPVTLEVAKDLYPTPRLVCFGVLRPGETRSRTVRLKRRSGRTVELASCRKAGEIPEMDTASKLVVPEFRILVRGGDSAVVELVLEAPMKAKRSDRSLSGLIELSATQGGPLLVKWLAVIQPGREQQEESKGGVRSWLDE